MNKNRRTMLDEAAELLRTAEGIVTNALEEEQDALANLPENLENSERYERIENSADCLDSALSAIMEAIDQIEEAKA